MVSTEESEFSIDDVLSCFDKLHFSKPNISRLKRNIKGSKDIVAGGSSGQLKLHAKKITAMDAEYPQIKDESEEVISDDVILPSALFQGTRGYVESLSRQINASYDHNIFDGCAVLMRRLLEILLIHSYENLGVESEIKDVSGNYKMLNHIVKNAKINSKLSLSRNTKDAIDDFRVVGNFSAHKIFYNAKRRDISKISSEYRAAIEELLYKSGIKT